jgi:hypothetical protein
VNLTKPYILAILNDYALGRVDVAKSARSLKVGIFTKGWFLSKRLSMRQRLRDLGESFLSWISRKPMTVWTGPFREKCSS